MRIFDAIIIVSDGDGIRHQSSAFLYVYVEDTDATFQLAIKAGAREIEPPSDMPLSRCTQIPEYDLEGCFAALKSRNSPNCCTQIPDRNRCTEKG